MKILRISLRNIASLEGTHTVDFTRDPLRSAGLFSISGIMGSGKSTLLDALCLALYEKTPRLHAVRGAVKLADGSGSISQNNPANLLRRGTGEGFAEVAFVGVDGIEYTARWTIRRARNRPEGALQNAEMTLFRGHVPPGMNGVIEQGGKKTEVLALIEAKVGLSFEQFTRAVLLAQNDFATFLKADDKERAEILQALTGTERFGAISIAVYARWAEEQRLMDGIKSRLAGNAPLAAEARSDAEVARAKAERAWKDAAAQLLARESHAVWFKRSTELSESATEASASLHEKITSREAAAPRRLELEHTSQVSRGARSLRDEERRLLAAVATAETSHGASSKACETAETDLAKKKARHVAAIAEFAAASLAFENARPQLLQARELDATLVPLATRLAAATHDREEAEAAAKRAASARETLRSKRTAAVDELTALAPKLEALSPFAPFASDASAWIQRLDLASRLRQALDDATTKLAFCEKEAKAKTTAAEAGRTREAVVRKAAADAATALEEAERAMRLHDAEKVARDRREADTTRTALRDLQNHLKNLDALASQAASMEADIAKLDRENDADASALGELQQRRIPAAEATSVAARRAFDLADAAVSNATVRLREKLVAGEPCIVCGATDHPHASHPPAIESAALLALRSDRDAKENETRALRETAAGVAATHATRTGHRSGKVKELASLGERLAVARAAGHEHPDAVAILALDPSERSSSLDARLVELDLALAAIDAAEAARRTAEKSRDERRSQRDQTAATLDALERKLAKLAEELAALRAGHEAAISVHLRATTEFQKCRVDLDALCAGLLGVCRPWEEDAAAFRERFVAETASVLSLERRASELNAIIRETDAALTPANESLERALTAEAAKRTAETRAHSEHEAVRMQRATLFSGRAADAMEAELAAGLHRATEVRDLCASELDQASNRFAVTAEANKAAGTTLAESRGRLTDAAAALDTWLTDFSARTGRTLDRAELEIVLARDEAWIKAERAALDDIEGAVRTAEGALAVRKKLLDEHSAARPTTDDEAAVAASLASFRAACEEAGLRHDEARTLLMTDDQRIKDNTELSLMLREREVLADPWLKLNELIGSADGAKFRGIAQRRTLDILLGYANTQLDLLAVRYRLERLPESLNLIVIDRDMGDERRSIHSLSGGESFLVSLALALALASLTSNRLRIESLFIDEGFGSLDPATLNIAMNALMHLEAQGRKVGVISHVSEMADAIPVQIRVVKGRSGASRLIVPGAPAEDLAADSQHAMPNSKIEEQILAILRRELAAGAEKVSARSVREEIGCDSPSFNAAREALHGKVRLEGRSLSLVEVLP